MPDPEIFFVGFFTIVLLAGGLAFTIYEVPRLHDQTRNNNQSAPPQPHSAMPPDNSQ